MKGDTVRNEDDLAQRLLEPLRGEPDGPPRIDVDRAMREGRRRRRTRHWSTALAVTAVTAVTAGGGTVMVAAAKNDAEPRPTASAPPSAGVTPAAPAVKVNCAVARLPTDGIKKALVTSGDPSGHYLAGRVYPPSGNRRVGVVLWKDGRIVDRPDMPGSDPSLDDINSSGIAVGTSFDGDRRYAYVYRDGAFSKLTRGQASVRAINDAGVMVGSIGPDDTAVPVRWPSPGAPPERLQLPRGVEAGSASDVDEDGTVLGSIPQKKAQGTGYLWLADGTNKAIPLPTVDGRKADAFWPDSMAAGKVIGRAVFEDKSSTSFTTVLYDIAADEFDQLTQLDGPKIAANGSILAVKWLDVDKRIPVLMAGGRTTNLPTKGKRDFVASSISRDGRVLAGYSVGSEQSGPISNDPWVWNCT